ncbi:MAG: alpha-1 4-glucan-protein synthase [Halobacteriota archaeon]
MTPPPSTTPDVCLIIPTVRDFDCLRAYIDNARRHGFDTERLFTLLVTEDWCDTGAMRSMLDELDVAGAVVDGSVRSRWFEEHDVADFASLIPEASHAQTSFGLVYMWANPHLEYGVFIDDDTLPHEDEDFFGRHLANLEYDGPIERVRSDTRWVNVLYQADTTTELYPRGYPYAAMGEEVATDTVRIHPEEVVASQGLWTNVPDLDAVRILMDGDLNGQSTTRTDPADFERDFVAARGQYLTVCSMNLAFKREIIPAFYQLPMDDNAWEIGRFDDIWSGVFLKRACDVLGRRIVNGHPLCIHNKAPRSTFDDLHNEAAGLELNEHLWQIVDGVGEGATTFEGVYRAIADRLREGTFDEYRNGAFLAHVGRAMDDWLSCLHALDQPVALTAD